MKTRKKIIILLVLSLFVQAIIFHNYLLPFSWKQLKVEGLSCTCPDLKVKTGNLYLKSITPDSLRKYKIDYSEIYLTENSYLKFPKDNAADAIFDESIIKGKVVGRKNITGEHHWNLVVEVSEWRTLDLLKSYCVKIIFIFEIFILVIYCFKIYKRQTKTENKNAEGA